MVSMAVVTVVTVAMMIALFQIALFVAIVLFDDESTEQPSEDSS